MSRRFATLPRRSFVRLRGGKIEFAVGLLLATLLQSKAAEASVHNGSALHVVPDAQLEGAEAVSPKLPEWLAHLDENALEQLSPEELKQLLDAQTLAQLGLDAEAFGKLLDTDLEEAIRQLEGAFRSKLKMAAAQAQGAVEDSEIRAAAAESADSHDGDAGADLGEGIPLLWIIGGIAAVGGLAYVAFDGDSNEDPEAVNDAFSTNEDTPLTFDVRANDRDGDDDTLVVTQINGAAIVVGTPVAITGGSLSLGSDGRLTFTPTANYNGTPTFSYTISDGEGGTSTASVTLTVNPVNDAPVAAADTFTIAEDTVATINVRANDTDVDGNTLTVTQVNGAAINATTPVAVTGGVVTLVNGNLVFTPTANYNGSPSFTYTVSDGAGGTATATVNGTVTPVNDAPVSANDTFTIAEDAVATINVRANDTDVDGNTLTVTQVNGAAINGTTPVAVTGGVVTLVNGNLVFTPTANYNGSPSFTYTVSDGAGGTATATVNGTVTPVNDAPVAVNDTFTIAEDTVATINVRANDTDVDGDTLTVTQVNGAAINATTPVAVTGGVVTLVAGNLVFTPTANFNGTPSFTYTVSDAAGATSTATVSGTVTPVNDAPVNTIPANGVTLAQNSTVAINGLSVADVDAGNSVITTTLAVQHGTLAIGTVNGGATVTGAGTGSITLSGTLSQINASLGAVNYTSVTGYAGADTLTITTNDGAATDTDVLNLSVARVTSGVVQDGYVSGAKVFIDLNGDGKFQDGEPTGFTDEFGRFSIASNVAGNIVAFGGVNTDTGLPNTVTLIAPLGSSVVNPLTTLVSAAMASGKTLEEASAQVKASLGLPANMDLGNYDILAPGNDPAIALAAQKAAVQIVTVLKLAGEAGGADAQAAVLANIGASLASGQTVKLDSPSSIASLLQGVPGVDAAAAAQLAVKAAAINQIVATATSLEDIVDTQKETDNDDFDLGPAVEDDDASAAVGGSTTINVLANDRDPEGLELKLMSVSGRTYSIGQPIAVNGGTVVVDANGGVTFTADAGFVGSTSFDYTVADPAGNTSTGTVNVDVSPDGPVLAVSDADFGAVFANAGVLADAGITTFDMTSDSLTLTDAQAGALLGAGIDFANDDTITVTADGTQLNTSLKGLQDLHVDSISASGRTYLSLDAGVGNLADLDAGSLPQFDIAQSDADLDLTLNLEAGSLGNTDLGTIAGALAGAGVDHLGVNGSGELSLNYAQAQALDAAGLDFRDGADITAVIDSADLGSVDGALLGGLNVDHIDVADDVATISDSQAQALLDAGLDFAASDTITVSAEGTQLTTTLKGLQDLHVDSVSASGRTYLSLDVGEGGLAGLNAANLPQFDVAQSDADLDVTLNVEAGSLDGVDLSVLAGSLSEAGIDHLAVADAGSLSLDYDQALALGGAGLNFDDASDITLTIDGGDVDAVSAGLLGRLNVDHIDAIGDVTISDDTAAGLVNAGVDFALSDNVTVAAGDGTVLNTSLKGLQDLNVDAVKAAGTLHVNAGDLSGLSAEGIPQFDETQDDGDLEVLLRVDVTNLMDLERLGTALREAGIDKFEINQAQDSLGAADLQRIEAITADTGIEFVYGTGGPFTEGVVSTFGAEGYDHGQVYRELLSTFEATDTDGVGDMEIADGAAASLLDAGMLRAYLSDNLVVDATGSGDKLLTTLKEISEIGIDQIKTADQNGAPVYVDLGIQSDASAVSEIQTLFKNLDLNFDGPDRLFGEGQKVGLVLDADAAAAMAKVDGAFEQLAGLGFTEVDVLSAPGGFSIDTNAIEVKLIGQDDDLYQHLHHER